MADYYNEFQNTQHPFAQHVRDNGVVPVVSHKKALSLAEKAKGSPLTRIEQEVVREEGFSPGWYLDTKGIPTTGIGQTGEWATKPFSATVTEHEKRVKRLIPDYDSLPDYLKADLTDSAFRGGITGSKNTVKLINEGKWAEAAKEFVDHGDFTKSVKEGTGVAPRMSRTAASMVKYGEALKTKPIDNIPRVSAGFPSFSFDKIADMFSSSEDNEPIKPASEKKNMATEEAKAYFNKSNLKPQPTSGGVIVGREPLDTGLAQYAPSTVMNDPRTQVPAQAYTNNPVFPGSYSGTDARSYVDLTSQATQKAVPVAGREPASSPVEYTAPMNADQRVISQLQALNGGLTPAIDPTVRVPDQIVNGLYPQAFAQSPQVKPPMADYPMGPTIEINRGAGQEPDPVANVLRDSAGRPVMSGNGNPIGLPNQSTGNVAGGKGGAGGK